MAEAITVTVERSDASARREFAIGAEGVHTVLDLLAEAALQDPSLAYRYSCRSGYCGTCTVLVDGRPGLACQTHAANRSRVHVAPLGGFPIVRDLIADMSPLLLRMADVAPLRPPVASSDAIDARNGRPAMIEPSRSLADESADCIACGACFAACDMSAADRPFLGPAALTRAMVVLADPSTPDRGALLGDVAGADGVDGCRAIGTCSAVCPKGLDPARAIRRIQRWRLLGLP
jgi:succinate dehydrogenase/fumarate reductase iron-sulfur protein